MSDLLNNPQYMLTESEIQMFFTEIFNFKNEEILPLLNDLIKNSKEHKCLIDFSKTLPNGKSLFTSISRLGMQNIQDIVNLLVENGADPNKPDEFDVYPLEDAIKIGNYELAVALINLKKINYDQKIPTAKKTFVEDQTYATAKKNNSIKLWQRLGYTTIKLL